MKNVWQILGNQRGQIGEALGALGGLAGGLGGLFGGDDKQKIPGPMLWPLGMARGLNRNFLTPMRKSLRKAGLFERLADPSLFSTRLPASERDRIEDQYSQGKSNLMATGARGGGLLGAMANLEGNRARTLSQASTAAEQLGADRALSFASGAVPTSGQVLGATVGGAGNLGGLYGQQAQMAAQQQGALGQGLGSILGQMGPGILDMLAPQQAPPIGYQVGPNGGLIPINLGANRDEY